MTQLAIKGHPTRGKEVIQLLEMLGGNNRYSIDAIKDDCVYFVLNDRNKTICSLKFNQVRPQQFIIYSLEDFEEKFPYKVGDKVKVITKSNNVYKIKEMMWNNKEIVYALSYGESIICWYNTAELRPHKEEDIEKIKSIDLQQLEKQLDEALAKETKESLEKFFFSEPEPQPKAPILSNRYDYAEGKCGYVIPDGYEFDYIKDGSLFKEIILKPKKHKYPKDYAECCEVLGCKADYFLTDFSYNYCEVAISEYEDKIDDLLQNFRKLRYCRDAYWKIAGAEMGLDEPWKPDWNSEEDKFCIETYRGKIIFDISQRINRVLAFPTEEIRDAFFEKFKCLIEECKELL